MCTLIVARDVIAPGTVFLAANRDESPGRPTDPPMILSEQPRIAGGRDRQAGGTWLAVREGPAVVALLNRRELTIGRTAKRSRGLLTLDIAVAPIEAARESALALVAQTRYAPFSLIYATPGACWMLVNDDGAPHILDIAPGWHALTHQELDDPTEPRAAYLSRRLREDPPSPAETEERVTAMLRDHGEGGSPPVCLHQGRMVTVSSSMVWLAEDGARYVHAEGRPCEHAYVEQTRLLRPALEGGRS